MATLGMLMGVRIFLKLKQPWKRLWDKSTGWWLAEPETVHKRIPGDLKDKKMNSGKVCTPPLKLLWYLES